MLSIDQAFQAIKTAIPDGKIQKYVEYKNLCIFMVFSNEAGEEEFDPFFSVNKETGEVLDFSILHDGDPSVIFPLFEKAPKVSSQ